MSWMTAAILSGTLMATPATERCLAGLSEQLDFSGVLSLSRAGAVSRHARGLAGGPGSAPLTPGHRFNLGSAGKMFTAVAVAQLADGGRIRLDDPIGRYLDGLTPEASAVSVRQLLTHSSGLGNYFTPDNLPAVMRARTLAELKPLIASDRPSFPPGSRFAYSNSGFLLLGLLVEKVSGQSYADYLERHVFQPAGMRSTSLAPDATTAPRAIGMTALRPDRPPPAGAPLHPAPEAALRGGPAGGAFSTVDDLETFFAALGSGKLVRPETYRALTSPQILAAPAKGGLPELHYGMGFGTGEFEGHRWFGHNGGAPGVNVEAVVFPEEQVTVVVLANRDPPAATALFRQLRRLALDPASPCP